MGMAVSDASFIGKRRKLVRFGPIVSGLCLALVSGLGLWIYFQQPRLMNYVEVARQIESGSLDQLTVELMAVMLPIAMLMCLLLLAAVVALSWFGLSKEKRYIRIIDELSR